MKLGVAWFQSVTQHEAECDEAIARGNPRALKFQSLTQHKAECDGPVRRLGGGGQFRFNHSLSMRLSATKPRMTRRPRSMRFQSLTQHEAECDARLPLECGDVTEFQSLTQHEAECDIGDRHRRRQLVQRFNHSLSMRLSATTISPPDGLNPSGFNHSLSMRLSATGHRSRTRHRLRSFNHSLSMRLSATRCIGEHHGLPLYGFNHSLSMRLSATQGADPHNAGGPVSITHSA